MRVTFQGSEQAVLQINIQRDVHDRQFFTNSCTFIETALSISTYAPAVPGFFPWPSVEVADKSSKTGRSVEANAAGNTRTTARAHQGYPPHCQGQG